VTSLASQIILSLIENTLSNRQKTEKKKKKIYIYIYIYIYKFVHFFGIKGGVYSVPTGRDHNIHI